MTAVTLSSDDARAFCASKDGLIVDWDVEYHSRLHSHAQAGGLGGEPTVGVPAFEGLNGAAGDRSGGRFEWPKEETRQASGQAGDGGGDGGGGGGTGGGRRRKKKKGGGKGGGGASRHVLALAVSSDGRYLAGGGYDRNVHLWDVRTRQHIQVCIAVPPGFAWRTETGCFFMELEWRTRTPVVHTNDSAAGR